MEFREIDFTELKFNPFEKVNHEWALVTAGDKDSFNTMTVSWGALGAMWNKPVAMVFLRPQRYTKEFVDKCETFTMSFFPKECKKALSLLGSKSGRDSDKVNESGLTPAFIDGTVTFEEAEITLICRRLFGPQQLDPSAFAVTGMDAEFYPDKDYHSLYFGEIVKTLVK